MVDTIKSTVPIAPQSLPTGSVEKASTPSGPGFAQLVTGIAQDAVSKSREADAASEAAANNAINDLDLVRTMTEAEISLQRFKTTYDAAKESLNKVLNMNL